MATAVVTYLEGMMERIRSAPAPLRRALHGQAGLRHLVGDFLCLTGKGGGSERARDRGAKLLCYVMLLQGAQLGWETAQAQQAMLARSEAGGFIPQRNDAIIEAFRWLADVGLPSGP